MGKSERNINRPRKEAYSPSYDKKGYDTYGWKYHKDYYNKIKSNDKDYQDLRAAQRAYENKYANTAPGKFSRLLQAAKKCGKEVEILREEFISKWNEGCPCGKDCEFSNRIDLQEDYTLTNLRFECYTCREERIEKEKVVNKKFRNMTDKQKERFRKGEIDIDKKPLA